MKKRIKIVLVLCVVFALFLSVSISASAENAEIDPNLMRGDLYAMWGSTTVSVPGTNGSGFSNLYIYKATTGTTASFKCTAKSADRNFDARIVNCYGQSRSSWARNLDIDDIIHVSESGAVMGYQYSCEISSDLFTFGYVDVSLDFSPDYLNN